MTPEDRIAILERAVSDLQRTLREYQGYAPPREADLIDHTPVTLLDVPQLYHAYLINGGITSVERLRAFVGADWSRVRRISGFFPHDGERLRRAVEALNLQPTP